MRFSWERFSSGLVVFWLSFGACNWHPSLADEKVIAEEFERLIDADAGIWQSQ